jgi:Cu2+-exporting ATPase
MNETCYHCSEAIPRGDSDKESLMLWEGEKQHRFCCVGCKAVFQFINGSGLNKYYVLRDKPATRLDAFDTDYTAFDSLIENSDFVQINGDTVTLKLLIAEMHCSACVWLLEKIIGNLSGVKRVSVSLQQRSLIVSWANDKQALSHIMKTIHKLGYRPEPWTAQARVANYQNEKSYLQRRLGVAGVLMMQIGMLSIGLYAGEWQGMEPYIRDLLRVASAALASIAILYCAAPFFRSAWQSVCNCRVNMDVPVSMALTVAYLASLYAIMIQATDVYFDTVGMFIFFLLLSRFIETGSREPDLSNSSAMLPLTADRLVNGVIETVPLSLLKHGDTLRCKKGERVVADGLLLPNSSSYFDESAFTGESLPRHRLAGDRLLAGTINTGEAVWYELHKTGKQSSIHRVEQLAEQAWTNKPAYVALIDKLSPWFVVLVLIAALFTAIGWLIIDPSKALLASMAVLVVSCPCALSLATPTALAVAGQHLRKTGVLPMSGRLMEQLPELTHVLFDKTGTLTQGKMTLQKIVVLDKKIDKSRLLQIAASLETYSDHPLAKALTNDFQGELLPAYETRVIAGCGVEAMIEGLRYRIGSIAWCADFCTDRGEEAAVGTSIDSATTANMLLCNEHRVLAEFFIDDIVRSDALNAVTTLQSRGYRLSILSGDSSGRVASLAQRLGIDDWKASQSPADKLAHLKYLQASGCKVLMVGDGINDSPVIAAADVSMAMCNASDLSRANADAVLVRNRLVDVVNIIDCAKLTRRIIRQNISWAIAYNSLAMPLAAFGFLPPWMAALGMSASSLVVVFNSQRLGAKKHDGRGREKLPAVKAFDSVAV